MIAKLKTFIQEKTQTAIVRALIITATATAIINMLSGGQLYKSGLLLVWILTIFEILKRKK